MEEEAEFQDIKKEVTDSDPIVRGMAAVDLGTFATEHPDYKDRSISLLKMLLTDSDPDVRDSAENSIALIEGKQVIEPGRQIIGFGYIPEELRQERPEIDQKQMILSCVCCIAMIVVVVLLFTL